MRGGLPGGREEGTSVNLSTAGEDMYFATGGISNAASNSELSRKKERGYGRYDGIETLGTTYRRPLREKRKGKCSTSRWSSPGAALGKREKLSCGGVRPQKTTKNKKKPPPPKTKKRPPPKTTPKNKPQGEKYKMELHYGKS